MLRRFAGYFHKYRLHLILSCLCVVLESVFELVIPLIMADIIDVGVAARDTRYILGKGAADGVLRPGFPGAGCSLMPVWPPWPARASVPSCAGRNTSKVQSFSFPTSGPVQHLIPHHPPDQRHYRAAKCYQQRYPPVGAQPRHAHHSPFPVRL